MYEVSFTDFCKELLDAVCPLMVQHNMQFCYCSLTEDPGVVYENVTNCHQDKVSLVGQGLCINVAISLDNGTLHFGTNFRVLGDDGNLEARLHQKPAEWEEGADQMDICGDPTDQVEDFADVTYDPLDGDGAY